MSEQVANFTPEPLWASGLSENQKSAIRREALRAGKTPTELVKEWILELSEKLLSERNAPHSAA